MPRVLGPVRYEYDSALASTAATTREPTGTVGASELDERVPPPAASYHATRLLFKAAVIEPLEPLQRFQVITPEGTFTMTKADFHRVFPNVVQSRSYREAGVYHYPKVPAAALEFRTTSDEPESA